MPDNMAKAVMIDLARNGNITACNERNQLTLQGEPTSCKS